jgi:hypothetical protein
MRLRRMQSNQATAQASITPAPSRNSAAKLLVCCRFQQQAIRTIV